MAEAVGRGYYESIAVPRAGYRNGYRRGRLRTAEGAIEYGVPHKAESITAELQGANTKYGCKYGGSTGEFRGALPRKSIGPESNFVARHEIRVGRSAYKAAHTAGTSFVATATKSRQDFHSEDRQSPKVAVRIYTRIGWSLPVIPP